LNFGTKKKERKHKRERPDIIAFVTKKINQYIDFKVQDHIELKQDKPIHAPNRKNRTVRK